MSDKKRRKRKPDKRPPIWIPVPEARQMYPHTHFDKELNINWVYSNMGILRSWAQSLTHLLLKLGELHNDDVKELAEEIEKLLEMIKSWISILADALKDYETAAQGYTSAVYSMALNLNALTEMMYNVIIEITPYFQQLFECIENVLKRHDVYFNNVVENINEIYIDIKEIGDQIENLYQYIDNIYEILNDILTGTSSTKTLTYGTDYTITFYNNFKPDEGYEITQCPNLRRATTELKAPDASYISDDIFVRSSPSYPITNGNTIIPGTETAPMFSHASSYSDVPESRVLMITFLDEDLKDMRFNLATQTGNQIFNTRPLSARATWDVVVAAGNDSPGHVMLYLQSISDGYNRQYYDRYDEELTFNVCNFNMTINYSYTR